MPHCYPTCTPSQIGSTLLALDLEGGKNALVMMAIRASPPSDLHEREIFNPRRAFASRVTVLGLSVCLLSHISPLECLFVLKILSHTQRATKVKTLVGISLKLLRCRDTSLPAL